MNTPQPIEKCKAGIGEWVLGYLYVPQKKVGMWAVIAKAANGQWWTDTGDVVVPSWFTELPPHPPRNNRN